MSQTKALSMAEAEDLEIEVGRAVDRLQMVASIAAQNVTGIADTGEPMWGSVQILRHEVENALQDAQESVAKLLPHLPE